MEKILKLLRSTNYQDMLIGVEVARNTLSEKELLKLFRRFPIKAKYHVVHYFYINKWCIVLSGNEFYLATYIMSETIKPESWIKL